MKRKPIVITGIIVGALLALCAFSALLMQLKPAPSPIQAVTFASPSASATKAAAKPAPAPTSITVKGTGSTVASAGAKLNGTFKVEYAFGSWCGMVYFLNASGEDGAGFMETVNDCASSTDGKLSGSTIVHLKDVSTLRTDNTKGPWTIKLTAIG
jgi:hypothetical protein